ncbi:MAG: DUF1573 domain-containing protein [Saprospiraceae bacterium]|nr:DUF1573 domain-containing protein [Saprospiraceae bacterium]
MKRFLTVLVLLMAIGITGFSQETEEKKQDKQKSTTVKEPQQQGPAMVFEQEVIDYGTIEQGADPFRIFKFKNEGTEPLLITSAKGSCGCTVPTYPKEPIMPGETGEIKVRYDTRRMGKFSKTVTLTTNLTDQRKILTIKGEVKSAPPEPQGVPQNNNPFNNGNNG